MSVSVGPGTSMSGDLDDRDREITAAAMLELANTSPTSSVGIGARPFDGNPSILLTNWCYTKMAKQKIILVHCT